MGIARDPRAAGRVIQGFFPGGRAAAVPRFASPPGPRQPQGGATPLPSHLAILRNVGGHPLPPVVQQKMEAVFGTSFQDVRVHVGPQASLIGALAFAHGSNLYFAPGQYDPLTPRGQQLLGHELAHVVQQRSGRVRNPFDSGIAVVHDHSLEAEAERMGQRAALYRAPAPMKPGAAAGRPAGRPRPSGVTQRREDPRRAPGPRPSVVQRDVGFEFEMNWAVKAPANTLGMDTDIITGTGWHAEPDLKPLPPAMLNQTRYTGYGNLEFVTDAFPETPAGRFSLQFTLNQIEGLVGRMASSWYGMRGWGEVRLSDFVNGGIQWGAVTGALPGRNDIWVDRNNSTGTASPQMSAGIRRERLSERSTAPHTMRTLIGQVQARAQVQAALRQATMTASEKQRYEGAVAHLGCIVAFGAQFSVTKLKYLHPLLSRTNFGSLPHSIRNHPNLIEDVIIASGLGTAATWAAQTGTALLAASPSLNQITIGNWLNGIIAGRDPLSWGQTGNLARWTPATVGPQGNRTVGHVYEFRGIARGGMPVDQWATWALSQFDYVKDTLNA
jgi:hypothetical protein